jgi:hypothetical protein
MSLLPSRRRAAAEAVEAADFATLLAQDIAEGQLAGKAIAQLLVEAVDGLAGQVRWPLGEVSRLSAVDGHARFTCSSQLEKDGHACLLEVTCTVLSSNYRPGQPPTLASVIIEVGGQKVESNVSLDPASGQAQLIQPQYKAVTVIEQQGLKPFALAVSDSYAKRLGRGPRLHGLTDALVNAVTSVDDPGPPEL